MDKSFETPPEHFVPLLTSGESKHLLGIANVQYSAQGATRELTGLRNCSCTRKSLTKSDNTIFIKFYNVHSYSLLHDTDVQPPHRADSTRHSAGMCPWCTSSIHRQIHTCTLETQITAIITQSPFTQKRITIRL